MSRNFESIINNMNPEHNPKEVSTSNNIVFTRNQNDFVKNLLLLQQQQKACDVTLIVNEERIGVHSNVLAASSGHFNEAFMELNQKEVTLNDIDQETIEMLINYCYSGTLETKEENTEKLVRAARVLSIPTFLESFGYIAKTKLNTDNCISYWKIAKTENIKNLESFTSRFIKERLVELSVMQDFLNLEYSEFFELISSDSTLPAMDVYKSMKRWINHNRESRLEFSDDLLKFVPMENLSLQDLINDASTMCDLNAKCLTKYLNAAKSHDLYKSKYSDDDCTLLAIGNDPGWEAQAELFDKDKREWIVLNDVVFKNKKLAILYSDDKLMMINSSADNEVELYDLETKRAESVPSLNHKRSQAATVKFNRNIYVFGGLDLNDRAISHVEKWDPISKTWSDVAPLITACYGCAAAVLDGKIYVVGGCIDNYTYLDITQVYDPSNDKWTIGKPMRYARSFAGVAASENYLYAVGGKNRHNQYLEWTEKYDPTVDQWTTNSNMYISKHSVAATNYSRQLVFAGGKRSDNNYENKVYTLNECNNGWTELPSMKYGRYNFNLVNIPWQLARNILSK